MSGHLYLRRLERAAANKIAHLLLQTMCRQVLLVDGGPGQHHSAGPGVPLVSHGTGSRCSSGVIGVWRYLCSVDG